jgi:LysR family transcriptional activator of glutamate synthase operon
VLYSKILDTGAARDICLRWSAQRRLLPAAELFRQHVISRATAGRVPVLSK